MQAKCVKKLKLHLESSLLVFFCLLCKMELEVRNDLRAAIGGFFATNRDLVCQKARVGRGADQEEAVHVMRVATKKIRTVYRLCQALSPANFNQKKAISELRGLFRPAGALRELQVHQAVVDTYEDLHVAFHRRLSKELAAEGKIAAPLYEVARKAFKKASFDGPAAKLERILKENTEEEVHAITVAFAEARLTAVHTVMPQGYEPEQIHQARIYLKEAMYLIGLLHSAGYTDDFKSDWLLTAKLAAEIAGDWHDREVFYQWLQIQLRPTGSLHGKEKDYALLLQDLHVHTRSLAKRFREAILPLQMTEISSAEARQ
jgi:CHAD domain-containing protein